jgi:CubicO group peptidase (beta-lactamase class C family)
MTASVTISGMAHRRFEAARRAFVENFARGEELGARFSAIVDGETVVDIWAGSADRDSDTPWTEETLAPVYSSGKAALSVLVARCVSDGALDYERPVAADWPEFAAKGKGAITLAMAQSHQAGLCGFEKEFPPEEWIEWNAMCDRIAAMAPLWPPGEACGYHPQTVGFILGELIRRKTGQSVGLILEEDYRARGIDIHCGMDAAAMARVAYMTKPLRAPLHRKNSRFTELAFLKPWSAAAKVSREQWMAAEIPASNMHATALALARITHPLARGGLDETGVRVIDADVVKAALAPRISGDDLVLPFHLTWSAGLMLNTNGHFGPNRDAYGHAGFGGSCVVIDPKRRMSCAYVMSKMSPALVGDERALRLIHALYNGF